MTQTFALILFLFPMAYSPGPGNLLFAANGARFGLRATLPASAGYHLATLGVTALVGLGFGGLVHAAPGVTLALRLAGAAYVLWLAVGVWRAPALCAGQKAQAMGFAGGAWLLLVNPKAWVIIALMFSKFQPADVAQALWTSVVFTLNNLVAFTAWTVLGDALARRFRDPAQAQRMNRAMAGLLAGVAFWMLLA